MGSCYVIADVFREFIFYHFINFNLTLKLKIQNKKVKNVSFRVYTPKSKSKKELSPLLVYVHGGGYFFGNLSNFKLSKAS